MYKILLMMVYLPYQLVIAGFLSSTVCQCSTGGMSPVFTFKKAAWTREPEVEEWLRCTREVAYWEFPEVLSCFEGMFFQHFYPPGNLSYPLQIDGWKIKPSLLEWSPLTGHVNFAGRGKWISYFPWDVVPTLVWRARKYPMHYFCTVHVLLASS